MTDPAPAKNPQPRGTRKGPADATWSHALFQLLLCAVVFVMANALSCQRFARYDSTRTHIASLSETTRHVLDAVGQRTRITVAFVRESPLRDKTWRLAQAYADARPNLVQARLLDPVRDPESARELAKRYNHEFKDNAVLVTRGKRIEVINASSLELQRRGPDGQPKTVGFVGEDALTAAFLRLVAPTPPVLYLVSGKGPWPSTTNGNGADTLRTLLPRYNATLKELSLDDLAAIPDDAAAILLANPRYDLGGKEIRLLREFWEQRKGGLFILLNPAVATPNIDAFLKFHGIIPDRRTVLKSNANGVADGKQLAVAARFLAGPNLTEPFLNADAKFPGTSAFLKLDTSRDDLRARGIKVFALAESEPGYWGESDVSEAIPTFDPAEDAKGPLTLAAGVERAAVEDERVRVPAARMLVLSNPHLLDPDALQQVNVDFFFSGLNWLLDRAPLIGIGPRQPVLYQATLSDRQSRVLHLLLLGILPGLALSMSWVVHQRRLS